MQPLRFFAVLSMTFRTYMIFSFCLAALQTEAYIPEASKHQNPFSNPWYKPDIFPGYARTSFDALEKSISI